MLREIALQMFQSTESLSTRGWAEVVKKGKGLRFPSVVNVSALFNATIDSRTRVFEEMGEGALPTKR